MPVESRYADIVKRIHKRIPVNTFVILNEISITDVQELISP